MSTIENAKEIFDAGIDNGDSRDSIIVAMVQGGCSLNSSQNWYKAMAAEAGISHAKVGHKAEAMVYITEADVDLLDDEVRNNLKNDLREEFGVAASTANDYVKAWAKENGVELPTASFGSNPEEQAKIFDWIVANPSCEKPEFRDFMTAEMGRSSGSIDETYRGILLARKLSNAGVSFA
jgi:hypothetical protein